MDRGSTRWPRGLGAPQVVASVLLLSAAGCGAPPDPIDDECGQGPGVAVFGVKPGASHRCKGTPATPGFGRAVDPYATYVGQSKCDPTIKPGVRAFRDLVLKTYGCTGDLGITRRCSKGGKSEHKEGRAWDWWVYPTNGAADDLFRWLLAKDRYGNPAAMARRVGIMYMIFNRKMWRAYRPADGWQPYTGSNPHSSHVHFSFSWDGAMGRSTFWSGTSPAPDGGVGPRMDASRPRVDASRPPRVDASRPGMDTGGPRADGRAAADAPRPRDDDEPLPPPTPFPGVGALQGGCNAAGGGAPAPMTPLLIFLAAALLVLRRGSSARRP